VKRAFEIQGWVNARQGRNGYTEDPETILVGASTLPLAVEEWFRLYPDSRVERVQELVGKPLAVTS
jgi:hypothetical protein